ncbi:biotin--[acetyl-CoA-carboxylase] ligase [Thermoflavimicrobium dichotomicum]|uniref:Bifunctional ligase/repressor BirA n=1 Tax=Thermoflavimicrobium dichotomicum TaxID=46223 RepID=A0A1I3SKE5_9BACL|nr:biotin--[acetyl-CoA-carboxylase] ligase [Thermoflavimicrobium dichotomicum]SFJ59238.1 BirA family transcriptional regulator, biotin operon repressor / biotin-[acetyl-CoA-carboxylase] ligase [Thermoflavimicrobium dichotomicum]
MGQNIRDRLLSLLIQYQPQFVSGEEISRELGCSRAAVWKHIEELRQEGYEIEARPRSGYRLLYRPDRVAPEEIAYHLHTKKFGREIRYQEVVASTQILAHQWAREGAVEGSLVVAEEQTEGRGRLGRSWYSPPRSGVWMSLILRPPILLTEASHLTLLASLGVKQGIERVTGLPIQIKWPNDLLVHGKKICGILTELRGEQDQIHYVILGMGINVNTPEKNWPEELRAIATSLAIELGGPVHRASLIAAILEELEEVYDHYLQSGFSKIKAKWEQSSGIIGKQIVARTPQGVITGIAEHLNDQGALIIRTDRGLVSVHSADVSLK